MTRAIGITAFLATAFCCLPEPASAYVYWECDGRALRWRNTNPVILRHASISFPDGNPFTAALGSAVSAWNLNPSGQALMLMGPNPGPTVAIGNRRNEIWFSSDEDLLGGAFAVTFSDYDCGTGAIVEADIAFNVNEDWTSSAWKGLLKPYGGSFVPFAAIAVHELGHLYGLDHEDRTFTIMFSWAQFHTNGSNAYPYPGEDASSGVMFLYGVQAPRRQDLAATHWKRIAIPNLGNVGHYRTVLYPYETEEWQELVIPINGFAAWRDNESEAIFPVYNGATVWAEFTYENNGADVQTARVDFYLSADDRITTADRRLNAHSLTLTPDVVYTKTLAATLPSNLLEGRDYFLGPLLDRSNSISEGLNEGNNATYTAVRIMPTAPARLTFVPSYVQGGRPVAAQVILNGAAPAGGIQVALASSDPYVSVPATVTVAGGAQSGDFEITTTALSGSGYRRVRVTAQRQGVAGVVFGDFYVRLNPGDPTKTFCEANPTSPVCQLCLTNPSLPLCHDALQATDTNTYRARRDSM